MNCPNCSNALRPNATFCPNCGQKITVGAASPVAPTLQPLPPTSFYAPQKPPLPMSLPAKPGPGGPPIAQLGATGASSSLWGPFAGYGHRREHVAWLLAGLGSQAEHLRDEMTLLFNQRQIPNARIEQVTLTGQGVFVEQRPFYRAQRGLSTVWLYVARFGEDLYISQVAYNKGPISTLRVMITAGLAGLVGLWLLNILAAAGNLKAVMSPSGFLGAGEELNGALFTALCCTGTLGLLALLSLMAGLAMSLPRFLTEGDPLALLRSPLTEFQEDDIVSLEKAVNETVRKAADLIGIDLKLLAPAEAYRSGRRLI